MKSFYVGLAVLAALALCSQAFASGDGWSVSDAAVAKIDQSVITVSDLRAEMEMIGWSGELAPAGPRIVTRDMVKRRLLFYQAEKLRMDVPREVIEKEVETLAGSGRGEDAFWARLKEFGLGRADVEQRTREIVLSRNFVNLKRRSTYVPEAEVRAFYRDNRSVFGDRPIAEVRDLLRDHLAMRKYQADLALWIDEQAKAGRVRLLPLPESLLQ